MRHNSVPMSAARRQQCGTNRSCQITPFFTLTQDEPILYILFPYHSPWIPSSRFQPIVNLNMILFVFLILNKCSNYRLKQCLCCATYSHILFTCILWYCLYTPLPLPRHYIVDTFAWGARSREISCHDPLVWYYF